MRERVRQNDAITGVLTKETNKLLGDGGTKERVKRLKEAGENMGEKIRTEIEIEME